MARDFGELQGNWRNSVWAKLVAVSFVVLILLGNIWFVFAFLKDSPPVWVNTGFFLFVITSFVGGGGLLQQYVRREIRDLLK